MQDFTNIPKSNYREQLEKVLEGLPPVMQLRELEKLAMKIRTGNSPEIYKEVSRFAMEHPKIKEPSNNYKR